MASFKTSEDYAQFIAEYHQAVDKIVEFYTANVDDQENTTLVSENFKAFKQKIENSDDQDSHRYYQVKNVLEEIAHLLVQPNTPKNPLNNKLAQIYELADRIIYCADGAITDILRASSNLFAPSPDLLSNMQKIKEKIAVNTLRDFMVQHAINNNIHTFNAFWDHFHQELALPSSQDRFRNLDLATHQLVTHYRQKLTAALTPYRITYQLAQDHLDFFRRQLAADRVNYDQIEAKAAQLSLDIEDQAEGFKPGYRNLDLDALFIQNGDKYQLRQDPILLQIEMAKKFSKAKVQAAWLNWSIQHLNNEQGNTFQRIGDLFWQETDGELMLPTIKNIGNFIHQISFGQLMSLIEQARDEADQALLRKIDPQRLQGANRQQINLFFSKLGLNGVGAINYAVAHRYWFQSLDNNPLISAIFQLDGSSLANIPAMLLHKMTASELSQFVEKLGDEESIRYAIKNLDWFQQLDSNPLIPVLLRLSPDKLPLVSIDLLHHITDQQASLFFSQMGVKEGIAYATRNFEWFLEFKNNPLLPLLLTLPHEQLMRVSDMLFHQMSSQQASQVFSHWGINDSLHYIRNNFEWFQQLASNPFVPILTKLTDHQLARLSSSLWHFMTVTTLCDLFEKRNNPNAVAYINYYINGSSFQDNQAPQNRLNNFQNMVLKTLLLNIVIIKIYGMNNAITGQTINTPSRLFLL
ncbi:hypothetical protein Rin_00019620 [Candidatus Regiella insecticola 5.15]|uniref:Uncharacterized protein n=1 Tax=Candidatus Regiella insecticola 5.15 TaxID=1005043 RepID=G2H1L9_9ENTR|nr:hypothetical protein [Candidatus Regiella insecticola]EGY28109.1 hypothetical protein Rin_00019620 [Candidatus Regiella insecticola 5.15]